MCFSIFLDFPLSLIWMNVRGLRSWVMSRMTNICPKIEIWSQTFKTWKYREWRATRGQDISKRKSRKQFNTDEKLFQGFYFLNSACWKIKNTTSSHFEILFHRKNVFWLISQQYWSTPELFSLKTSIESVSKEVLNMRNVSRKIFIWDLILLAIVFSRIFLRWVRGYFTVYRLYLKSYLVHTCSTYLVIPVEASVIRSSFLMGTVFKLIHSILVSVCPSKSTTLTVTVH